jgi:DNA-nicking Smr family endonuclease
MARAPIAMKRPRKDAVHPDDKRLFREAVADAVPLSPPGKFEQARPLPPPVASQRLRDERAALSESLREIPHRDMGIEAGDELSYARKGLGTSTLRKLRRGHWAIQAELDLHGLTVEQARAALTAFLQRCRRSGLCCVRVIHGKGLGSRNREPVIKRHLPGWLVQKEEILAFCQARPAEGGSGAVIALLKNARR